ncbi:MAG: acyl-CoA dehydrogenase family protein [Ilumatobacteraceae bacterium]
MTGVDETVQIDAVRIDADDLAMLADGFASAMLAAPDSGDADAALFDLGWGELLAAAPSQGAAMAFSALGATGSSAALVDDVLAQALGFDVSPTTCVALPRPHRATPPATRRGDVIRIDGLVSTRIDTADTVVVAIVDRPGAAVELLPVDADHVRSAPVAGLDPSAPYRRLVVDLPADALRSRGDGSGTNRADTWAAGVAAARVALAHQLIGASRWMLDAARTHAIDRTQFGRSVASFQAVRHKLAESLVAIEGAHSVAGACTDDVDPLLAAVAKSLAGKAARTTATNAQQVLAGIGFTTDHEFHLWLKRTLVVDTVFGSASSIPTEIGYALLAGRTAPRLLEL